MSEMDETLKGILEEIHLAVRLSIQKYKEKNDISFIELALEKLSVMVDVSKKGEKKPGMDNFLAALQGLIDGLNEVIGDNKKKVGDNVEGDIVIIQKSDHLVMSDEEFLRLRNMAIMNNAKRVGLDISEFIRPGEDVIIPFSSYKNIPGFGVDNFIGSGIIDVYTRTGIYLEYAYIITVSRIWHEDSLNATFSADGSKLVVNYDLFSKNQRWDEYMLSNYQFDGKYPYLNDAIVAADKMELIIHGYIDRKEIMEI